MPKLRWYQYRLRSLLLLMTISAILCKAGFPLWEEFRHLRRWRQEQQQREAAVGHALRWLMRHQAYQGNWSVSVLRSAGRGGGHKTDGAVRRRSEFRAS